MPKVNSAVGSSALILLCMWAVCSAFSYAVQQIHDGLYSVSDSAYNTMFLVTSVEVIAVDARPS